jgi:predicted ATP-dependent endonuclease of OLD family
VQDATLGDIAQALWRYNGSPGEPWTGATLKPRLQTLMTPWLNEGFFADVVVLVEGEEDRGALLGYAGALRQNFDSKGISVIPCMGKNNLDRAALIFDAFGIPVYLVWDSDEGDNEANPNFNRCLLRIVHADEEDFPSRVEDKFACFKKNLTTTLREEIGEPVYGQTLSALKEQFKLKGKDVLKNPALVQELITRAVAQQRSSPTLERIIAKINARREAAY